jgi:P-type Cu+ transporter
MNDSEGSGTNLKDPVCGMEVPPDTPLKAAYQGQEYFFCSEHCLTEFNKNPPHYTGEVVKTEKVQDPVCGMLVQPDSPHRFTYNGKDFLFCSPRCLELFQSQPERYLQPAADKTGKAVTPAPGKD